MIKFPKRLYIIGSIQLDKKKNKHNNIIPPFPMFMILFISKILVEKSYLHTCLPNKKTKTWFLDTLTWGSFSSKFYSTCISCFALEKYNFTRIYCSESKMLRTFPLSIHHSNDSINCWPSTTNFRLSQTGFVPLSP